MLGKITGLMIILFVFTIGISQAQTNKRLVEAKKMVVTGLEKGESNGNNISYNTKSNLTPSRYDVRDMTFNWNPTNLWSGYDLQSNSTPRDIWVDTSNSMNVHAIFMWSSEINYTFSDRTMQYLYSTDAGVTWLNVGQVPPSGNRSGYGAISGYASGIPLVACHTFNTASATTRAMAYKDDDIGFGTFSMEFDPGVASNETTIWPRVAVIDDDDFALVSSGQTQTSSFYVNFYNTTSGYSGWQQLSGDQAETYDWAVSEDGSTVGLVYTGNSTNYGDVYYRQTTDFGVTWDSTQIWQTYTNQDSIDLGALRVAQLTFVGNTPVAAFEVGGVSSTGLYPDYPSSVYFWNPEINGGVAFSIADTTNVPFNTHWYWQSPSGTVESFLPLCKPSIGKSSEGNALFVTFVATTPFFYGDTTTGVVESYYAGWITSSFDSGATWTPPVKFTPDMMDGHLQDYRFVSLSQISGIHDDSICTVQMAVQVDSIPGSQVTSPSAFPPQLSATEYIVNTDVTIPSLVITGVNHETPSVYSYSLQQNYPNPFNPTTKISYSLAKRSNVLLKVYNMLGQEVATLVNSQQEVGSHSINFDASKLASGLYIYKLQAGNFTQSKKMMLLK